MSLIRKHEVTEKQLAANRENQKLCNAPVTDERRERIRAALRRFGYNVQAEEIAMRGLGEDPADFQELLEALWEEWNPVGSVQEGVVIRPAGRYDWDHIADKQGVMGKWVRRGHVTTDEHWMKKPVEWNILKGAS